MCVFGVCCRQQSVGGRLGGQVWAGHRRFGRRRQGRQEEAAAAAAHALHVAAAAGARGHLLQEQVPRHEHQGGDRHVDQPHRGQSQGESHFSFSSI